MRNKFLTIAIVLTGLFSTTVLSQSKDEPVSLGLPGDDLDLYAVMEVFQKSKTIEGFEKSLNEEKSKLNNLDLDNDKKVDFIKVVTNKEDDDFSFVLQVAVSKTENQDVAVIFVSKDKAGKVSMQIVGDEDLYGKDYVIEPKGTSGGTANPGYTGGGSETMNIPAQSTAATSTTTVVVESAPIVQYVYSPAYVPYYPPYYYGFYPPYFHPIVPIARAVFWANNFHCHGGYYGGYHGNVNINVNHVNHFNNYNNNSRNRSTTVANNKRNGNYGNRAASGNNRNASNRASTRPSGGASASTRPSNSNRASAGTRPTSPSASTRESGRASTRPTSPSASTRESNRSSSRASSSDFSRPSSSSRSSSYSGGGRSSGGFSGGGFSGGRGGGGGMRGGGGRR